MEKRNQKLVWNSSSQLLFPEQYSIGWHGYNQMFLKKYFLLGEMTRIIITNFINIAQNLEKVLNKLLFFELLKSLSTVSWPLHCSFSYLNVLGNSNSLQGYRLNLSCYVCQSFIANLNVPKSISSLLLHTSLKSRLVIAACGGGYSQLASQLGIYTHGAVNLARPPGIILSVSWVQLPEQTDYT